MSRIDYEAVQDVPRRGDVPYHSPGHDGVFTTWKPAPDARGAADRSARRRAGRGSRLVRTNRAQTRHGLPAPTSARADTGRDQHDHADRHPRSGDGQPPRAQPAEAAHRTPRRPHHHAAAVRQHPCRVRFERQGHGRRRLQVGVHRRGLPGSRFVYNESYDSTNTSKSLLRALKATGKDGVLWMNGDVVFDPRALVRAADMMDQDRSFVSVNTEKVSDEEVKYTVDAEGFIHKLRSRSSGVSAKPSASTTSRPPRSRRSSVSSVVSTTRSTSRAASRRPSLKTVYAGRRSTSPTCTRSRSTSPRTSSARTTCSPEQLASSR